MTVCLGCFREVAEGAHCPACAALHLPCSCDSGCVRCRPVVDVEVRAAVL